jgi:hypothetical protein
VRFLIDECLSVYLVTVARQAGHEAHHVAHIGRAGWKDWNVVRYARAGEFILVTNNATLGVFIRRNRCMPVSSFFSPLSIGISNGGFSTPRSTRSPPSASRSTVS